MKKILFAIFAMFALALTSCEKSGNNIMDIDVNTLDNTTPKCWVYHIEEFKETSYIWCSNVFRKSKENQKKIRSINCKNG